MPRSAIGFLGTVVKTTTFGDRRYAMRRQRDGLTEPHSRRSAAFTGGKRIENIDEVEVHIGDKIPVRSARSTPVASCRWVRR